ncbi:MAG: CCA tRNA nucleotidyltransferase [Eubacteriales bacterium]|nr:CCA tRNA nucleotidyltransferase [Eubacteriales bacterium]
MSSNSEDLSPEPVKSYRDAALYCIERLEANNFEAYVVGGTVRDIFLGREISDLDLATSALPEEVHLVFSAHKVLDTGIKHGTVTLILPAADSELLLEITTYRLESTYSDARHPDQVEFTNSIEEDLARRDLTINAMAWHPNRGILDPYGGQQDLKAEILRAVGKPRERYQEDALRILRTLRFAAELGFSIEEHTEQALLASCERLALVAAERLNVEFLRLITAAHSPRIMDKYWSVIAVFLPELSILADSDVRKSYLPQLNQLPAQVADRLAYLSALALLYRSADAAATICKRLKCSKSLTKEVSCLSEYAVRAIPVNKLSVDEARQHLSRFERSLEDLLLLKTLLGQSLEDIEEFRKIDQELSAANLNGLRSLDIDGQDLIALGFEGEAIGAALDNLYKAVLCENLPNDKATLLERANTYLHRI